MLSSLQDECSLHIFFEIVKLKIYLYYINNSINIPITFEIDFRNMCMSYVHIC
jgi:hypothetical protein